MAAIPGSAYLIIGILMSVFSFIVQRKTHILTFWFFFAVGIIFFIIGIGKQLFKNEKSESVDEPLNQPNVSQLRQPFQQQQAINPQNMNFSQGQHNIHKVPHQPEQHVSVIACPACGTRHYYYARYCMQCGTRIRH